MGRKRFADGRSWPVLETPGLRAELKEPCCGAEGALERVRDQAGEDLRAGLCEGSFRRVVLGVKVKAVKVKGGE